MLIKDLPYFENALETIPGNAALISGSAGTGVSAGVSAFGVSTTAVTRTDSKSKLLPNGGSLSISRGWGLAKGGSPLALVTTAGYGDIVVGSTHSTPDISSKPTDVAHGVVVAIDLPS